MSVNIKTINRDVGAVSGMSFPVCAQDHFRAAHRILAQGACGYTIERSMLNERRAQPVPTQGGHHEKPVKSSKQPCSWAVAPVFDHHNEVIDVDHSVVVDVRWIANGR